MCYQKLVDGDHSRLQDMELTARTQVKVNTELEEKNRELVRKVSALQLELQTGKKTIYGLKFPLDKDDNERGNLENAPRYDGPVSITFFLEYMHLLQA